MKKLMILVMLLFIGGVYANPVIIPAHICLKSTSVTVLDKIAQLDKGHVGGKVVNCPDGKGICDEGQTCCLSSTGEYNCCPAPNATCCSDKIHCCPNSFTCKVDPEGGTQCVH
jgi:hypothetical protein